ncbi:MAG: hypothetical protein M1827_007218 [Pycnora praestabilis]|nr:MAG: hypothetical protein M1827_007218 [Pycnora praestabilis]
MAELFNKFFGGQQSAASPIPTADADFADFAGAPDPSPASISPLTPSAASAQPAFPTVAGSTGIPYTKWYRIWERKSLSDFWQEGFILVFISIVMVIHLWGTRTNRRKAKTWFAAHAPILEKEFALIGFGGRKTPSFEDIQSSGLAKAIEADELANPEELLKEKTAQEYITYASGRQNVAFVDIKLNLFKRYNPLTLVGEYVFSFFFDSIPKPVERMEATLYPFDGKEAALVPIKGGKQGQDILEQRKKNSTSGYDGFVWAIVNKDGMRQLRDDRYDVSLTGTKDHPKLPNWATVMSESSEVTEFLLTPELVKAVEEAGELLEYLVITDQPLNKPEKLNETIPKKRINLSIRLPSNTPSSAAYASTLPLFTHFIRLSDQLSSSAHFRPEVMRKVRQTRDDEIKKLKKVDDEGKAEERAREREKEKKKERDGKLGRLSAEEQRRFLEKEREKEMRKSNKRMTKKG